jgi:pyrimidine-nucleoside phosphorylase
MTEEGWIRRALAAKRDGAPLAAETWTRLVAGYLNGAVDEAQMAALAMACTIRGMAPEEIAALTAAMVHSGDVLDFPTGRTVVDKHSSGGVGDAVSLVVVPLVAACGVPVAKLSGRALGHTGGTLDKLEAIPGLRTDLEPAVFRAQVERVGCAIAAQGPRLVPADKQLYALRDRTGSVPSPGLIAASIVSKKIAGGAGAIVYDVKLGGAAFLRDANDALGLAQMLVDLSGRFGRRASALVTAMDEPLATNVGTAVEAIEARDFLREGGSTPNQRFAQLVRAVALEMLQVGGVDPGVAAERFDRALASGAAYEMFVALVVAQGGDRRAFEGLAALPAGAPALAERDGFVAAIDGVAIGEAARDLVAASGSRAGIRIIGTVGTAVRRGEPLAEIRGAGDATAIARAFAIAAEPPEPVRLIQATVRDAEPRAASKGASE